MIKDSRITKIVTEHKQFSHSTILKQRMVRIIVQNLQQAQMRTKFLIVFLLVSSFCYSQNQKETSYHRLEQSYLALNAIDLMSTFFILDNGGRELNPLFKSVVKNQPLTILSKGAMTASTLILLRKMKKTDYQGAKIILITLNIIYSGVIANNISVSIKIH